MAVTRIFQSAEFFQPNPEGEPIRSVVTESQDAVVVAWFLQPGQVIAPHVHPQGQDTWTILTGKGDYTIESSGTTQAIVSGDVVVAPIGAVHGVKNTGTEPLSFISVVTPADAGYELVTVS
jgi:quercetin dioxygenase-like cupin family protein